MTLVEIINERYNVAKQNLVDIYNAPPTTYRERRDYQKAVNAGRIPTKQFKNTLKVAHDMEVEQKYINIGMQYVIDFIIKENVNVGGVYDGLLSKIGQVDKEITQAAYEK